MTTVLSHYTTLQTMECGKCAGVFALTDAFVKYAKENAAGYNCPYCTIRWTYQESEVQRLRKQLEEKSRALVAANCETLKQRQLLDAEKLEREKAEKKLRRVKNGVCPCCNRSFINLEKHMKTKHPLALQ